MKKRIIAFALCFVMLLGCLGMRVDALTDTAPLYDRLITAQTADEFDAITAAATEDEITALTDEQLADISNRYAAILGDEATEPITYASSSVNNVGPLVKQNAVQTKARLAKAMAADDGQNGPFTPSDDGHTGLFLNKNVTKNADGTYKLTLESFVTGDVKITQEKLPADIVLVLDVSGSMDENITVADTRYNTIEELYEILDSKYGGEAGTYFWGKLNNYKIRFHEGKWQTSDGAGRNWHDIISKDLYGDQAIKISKLNALKIAVKNFVDQVQIKAGVDDVEHTISIVKFAGKNKDTLGNDTYIDGVFTYNYSQIVLEPTSISNADDIKNTINGLSASGATHADFGMQHAQKIIKGISRHSNKVVVMFTDGEPTSNREFEENVANDAINASYYLKNNHDTTVYTIGVFEEGKADDSVPMKSGANDITKYMNYVSSNFKDAWDIDATYTQTNTDKDKPYFKLAGSASEMTEIFDKISEEVSGGAAMQLGSETILRDIVTSDFELISTDISSVKVYTADYIERGTDGKRIFAERKDWKEYNANVKIKDGNTVEVKGFDYSSKDNCVTDTKNADGSTTYSGKKLIVEFDIKVSDSCMGGGWFDTNTNASAIYNDKGENDKGELVGTFPVPEVNVPRKTFDLIIKKEAAEGTTIDPSQTFVFTVKGDDKHTKDVNTQVIIKGDGSVTLKDLPVGKYTVTEDTNWSWRYEPDTATQTVVASNTTDKTVTFVNSLENNKWLSFLNRITNIFGKAS